jgi:guanylate kinase
MSTQNVTIKAYEEKISAQLQQAKAQLVEFEARAKGKAAHAEIDIINRLKTKHEEIDKKRQDLKAVGEAKIDQAKAEIDSEVAKLKTSLADLAAKLRIEPRTKAG